VQVYPGDAGDPTTVPDRVAELSSQFGLSRIVLVGDRGMLTQARIDALKIGVKAGRVVGRYKMAKHVRLRIGDGLFTWERDVESIDREKLLSGIHVVRTSEPSERLPAPDGVRSYRRLSRVEQASRCLQGIDSPVRPVHRRLGPRVRAHALICVLAYYVEWHLRRAWRPLLLGDEGLRRDRAAGDPVAAAGPSDQAAGGLPVHGFRTLLAHLGRRGRESCRVVSDPSGTTFEQITERDPVQREALRLLETWTESGSEIFSK
jgi:hypothetical protein